MGYYIWESGGASFFFFWIHGLALTLEFGGGGSIDQRLPFRGVEEDSLAQQLSLAWIKAVDA